MRSKVAVGNFFEPVSQSFAGFKGKLSSAEFAEHVGGDGDFHGVNLLRSWALVPFDIVIIS